MRSRKFPSVRVLVRVCLGLTICGSWACTLLLSDEPQCRVDSDCASRGFTGAACVAELCVVAEDSSVTTPDATSGADAADAGPRPQGPFACLGDPPSDGGAPSDGGTAVLRVPIIDLVSATPVPGLRAKVCPRLDVQCLKPIATVTGGDDGILTANVPIGFDGYFEVEKTGYCTALVFMEGPVRVETQRVSANLARPEIVTYLKEAAYPAADLNKGVAFVSTLDCDDKLSSGVNVSNAEDASTTSIYLVNGTPTVKTDRTGAEGRVGVVDLPVGFSSVRCKLAETGREIGTNAFATRAFRNPFDQTDAADASPDRCYVTNAICAPSR